MYRSVSRDNALFPTMFSIVVFYRDISMKCKKWTHTTEMLQFCCSHDGVAT